MKVVIRHSRRVMAVVQHVRAVAIRIRECSQPESELGFDEHSTMAEAVGERGRDKTPASVRHPLCTLTEVLDREQPDADD